MIFLADERRKDGTYGHEIDAADWQEAERICVSLGWKLCGQLEAVIEHGTGNTIWDREAAEAAVANLLATPPHSAERS